MAETAGTKQERVQLRPDAGSRRKLERAGPVRKSRSSRSVLNSAVVAADRVIEAHVLPATDRDAFHDTPLNPPAPDAALKRTVCRYREPIGG